MPGKLIIAGCIALCLVTVVVPPLSAAGGPVLIGSHFSMVRQNRIAHEHDFTFARTAADVYALVRRGYLVPVREDDALLLRGVSFRVTRPTVRLFLHDLSGEYSAACGRPLVVTSLTRPVDQQPWNASPLSVHPAGMAVDLRRPGSRRCRTWLEARLLELEGVGVLDVTRERNPPHYHVAVFPEAYRGYRLASMAPPALDLAMAAELPPGVQPPPAPAPADLSPTRASAVPPALALLGGMAGGLLLLLGDVLRRRRGGPSGGAGRPAARG